MTKNLVVRMLQTSNTIFCFKRFYIYTPVRSESKNSLRVRRDKKNLRTTDLDYPEFL